jgi:hypothetical protein
MARKNERLAPSWRGMVAALRRLMNLRHAFLLALGSCVLVACSGSAKEIGSGDGGGPGLDSGAPESGTNPDGGCASAAEIACPLPCPYCGEECDAGFAAPACESGQWSCPGEPDTCIEPDAGAPDGGDAPTTLVTKVTADSLVTDSTNIYWRSSQLDSTQSVFDVALAECPLAGGCAAGGTVLGTTTAQLVFAGPGQVALAAGKVIAPVGGALLSCATGGCGGTLATLTATPGVITSVVAVGTQLFFGETGAAGARFMESCDVASCATPTQLGATSGAEGAAPGDPSVAGSVLAFKAGALFVAPTTGFADGGATQLADLSGVLGGGIWNDGTNVYFGVQGTFTTDDAGVSSVPNGTGYVARCAVTGCAGAPTKLATGESNVGNLVVDGTDIYWAVQGPYDASGAPTGPGSILTCSTSDLCASIHPLVSSGNPSTLTADATYVYWADPTAQTISRVRRH